WLYRRNLVMPEHVLKLENIWVVRFQPQKKRKQGFLLRIVESVIITGLRNIFDRVAISDLRLAKSLTPIRLISRSFFLHFPGTAHLYPYELVIQVVSEIRVVCLTTMNAPFVQRKGLIDLSGAGNAKITVVMGDTRALDCILSILVAFFRPPFG